MRFRAPLLVPVSLFAAMSLTLAGCAHIGSDSEASGQLRIVASTNVYGDLAATIAGDAADVTSIIHDTALDPHEYEATPRDALAIADADLVIVNGGGYDAFMATLLEAHTSDVPVLDVVELSGLGEHAEEEHAEGERADDGHADADEHADGEHADDEHAHEHDHDGHDHGAVNEHVWYSLEAMATLAHALAAQLAELDPASADTFAANADEVTAGIAQLAAHAAELAAQHGGADIAVTEPVPLYLLAELGLHNVTPAEFSRAIEGGTDAPALVVREVVTLVSDGSVALLAYNEQTAGPQTDEVLAAARDAGTPVVAFSELLPEGQSYLDWMRANLDAIAEALA